MYFFTQNHLMKREMPEIGTIAGIENERMLIRTENPQAALQRVMELVRGRSDYVIVRVGINGDPIGHFVRYTGKGSEPELVLKVEEGHLAVEMHGEQSDPRRTMQSLFQSPNFQGPQEGDTVYVDYNVGD